MPEPSELDELLANLPEPSASVLARRRNAAAANKRARDENRLLSNVAVDDAGRDARDWLVAHGWTIRAAVSQGLVLLAQRERGRGDRG